MILAEQFKKRADSMEEGYQIFRGSMSDEAFLLWCSRVPEPFSCLDKNNREFYVDLSGNRLSVPNYTQSQRTQVNRSFDSSRWGGRDMFVATDTWMMMNAAKILETTE